MRVEVLGIAPPGEPDSSDRLLIFVRLEADPLDDVDERPPAHLTLALDISSSMGGPPLASAVSAVRGLLARLGPADRLGVVCFDNDASILFQPQAMTDEAKAELVEKLGAIRPGLGTNLSAGYRTAAELLCAAYIPGARPRVLLLTDGYPSAGFVDVHRFETTARELAGRGLTTSTIGFGVGYDEELLRAIARAGDGAYHFVHDGADLAAILAEELCSAHEVEATGATVKLHPGASIVSLELLHRYPTRAEPDGLVVEVGSVGRQGPRRLLFETCVKPNPSQELARIRVSWSPVSGQLGGAVLPVVREAPAESVVREIHREKLLLGLTQAENALWERLGHNDRTGASQQLEVARRRWDELAARSLCAQDELKAHRSRFDDAEQVIAGRLDEKAALRRARSAIDATAVSRIAIPRLRDRDE